MKEKTLIIAGYKYYDVEYLDINIMMYIGTPRVDLSQTCTVEVAATT